VRGLRGIYSEREGRIDGEDHGESGSRGK